MIDDLEAQFTSIFDMSTSNAVFTHIDGNRCCRVLSIKFSKANKYESRFFKFERFENLKPMYESLPITGFNLDHDHLQIYWDDNKDSWQIIKAGKYVFNGNDHYKDTFSLRLDRQRGESPPERQNL